MENEKEKARKILDEETENEEEQEAEKPKAEEKQKSAGEVLRELTTGTLKLLKPFRAHSQDVEEVRFDFCGLTTDEEFDALDSVTTYNFSTITNKQALALFAATAGKCAPEVDDDGHMIKLYDAKDIKKRLGPADAIKAVQLAKLFYTASSQAGDSNISRE
jgi:hypothetical protein